MMAGLWPVFSRHKKRSAANNGHSLGFAAVNKRWVAGLNLFFTLQSFLLLTVFFLASAFLLQQLSSLAE
jgi:hypothetical protein